MKTNASISWDCLEASSRFERLRDQPTLGGSHLKPPALPEVADSAPRIAPWLWHSHFSRECPLSQDATSQRRDSITAEGARLHNSCLNRDNNCFPIVFARQFCAAVLSLHQSWPFVLINDALKNSERGCPRPAVGEGI